MMNGNSPFAVNDDSNAVVPTAVKEEEVQQQLLKQESHEEKVVEVPPSAEQPPIAAANANDEPAKNEQENQQGNENIDQKKELISEQDSTSEAQPQKQQQNEKPKNSSGRPDANCFLRCRGLPYSAGVDDVRKFFKDYNVDDIIFTNSADGRPSGECYVQFDSPEQASRATGMDRQMMGKRYVEVFTVVDAEMEHLMKKIQMRKELSSKGYIRVRGLPYSCTKMDLEKFFQGLSVEEVVFGNTTGPGLDKPKPSGEGMVKLGNSEQADKALLQNGQHLGTRYLEIFKTDGVDYEAFKARAQGKIVSLKDLMHSDPWGPPTGWGGPPYSGGGGYGGYGGVPPSYGSSYEQRGPAARGLMGRGGYSNSSDQRSNRYSPYGGGGGRSGGGGSAGARRGRGSGARDDYGGYGGGGYGGGYGRGDYGYGGGGGYNDHLVSPSKIYMQGLPFQVTAADIERFFAPLVCVNIMIGTTTTGRPNGDGLVEFQSPDQARQAMAKDRDYIGNRYIELIPSTSAKLPDHVRYDRIGGNGVGGGISSRGLPLHSAQPYGGGVPSYGGGGGNVGGMPPPMAVQQHIPPSYGGGGVGGPPQPHPQSQQYPSIPQPVAPSKAAASAPVYGGAGYQQQQTPGLPQSQQSQQSASTQQPLQQQPYGGGQYGYGGGAPQYEYGSGGGGAPQYGVSGGGAGGGGFTIAGYGGGSTTGGGGGANVGGSDYSNSYYSTYGAAYGGGPAGQEPPIGQQGMQPPQQPKPEYNWPTAQF